MNRGCWLGNAYSQAYISEITANHKEQMSQLIISVLLQIWEGSRIRVIKILAEMYIDLSKGPDFPKHRVPHFFCRVYYWSATTVANELICL